MGARVGNCQRLGGRRNWGTFRMSTSLHFDLVKLNMLMSVERSQVLKFLTSGLTPFRWHRYDFSGCQKRRLMPFVTPLGSGFARPLRFSLVYLMRGVRGGAVGRVLRILAKPCFELFHALAQLCKELMVLQDQRSYIGRSLLPVLFADGKTVGKILHPHPGTLQFQLFFALCSILRSPLLKKLEYLRQKMHARENNATALNSYQKGLSISAFG